MSSPSQLRVNSRAAGSLALVKQPVKEKETLNSNSLKKLIMCYILLMKEGFSKYFLMNV